MTGLNRSRPMRVPQRRASFLGVRRTRLRSRRPAEGMSLLTRTPGHQRSDRLGSIAAEDGRLATCIRRGRAAHVARGAWRVARGAWRVARGARRVAPRPACRSRRRARGARRGSGGSGVNDRCRCAGGWVQPAVRAGNPGLVRSPPGWRLPTSHVLLPGIEGSIMDVRDSDDSRISQGRFVSILVDGVSEALATRGEGARGTRRHSHQIEPCAP